MALRSLIQLRGLIESLPSGTRDIAPVDLQNATPPDFCLVDQLSTGDNIIPIPAQAIGCIIIPASNSTAVKTLKGNAADVGIIISKNTWTLLSFNTPPPVSFILNSAADGGKYTTVLFF
jgi:hypothetical protein